jgi:hypothetical protein
MSMQSEGKDAKGRNYDQVTRNGASSAGSMGAGGTGDVGKGGSEQSGQAGNLQAGRTDDLLAGGSDAECEDKGFMTDGKPGQLGSGMGNLGSGSCGNRQSGELNQQGSAGQRTTETDRDQDSSARER